MDEYKIQKQTLTNIANAINSKTGSVAPLSPTGMVSAIESIQPAKTEQSKTLTLGAFAPATVLPDSGKVLSSVPVVLDPSIIKAENFAKDVTILGITGTHEGGMDEDAEFVWFISTIPIVASYSEVTTLRSYALAHCSALTTVSFPACTTIGPYAFSSCSALTTISFPVCATIGSYAFTYCSALTTVSFPVCTTIGNGAFSLCGHLTTVSFPVCTTIGSYAFYSCPSLKTVSFPVCTAIGSNAFYYCQTLISLYLTGSQYVTLSASNAFTYTPIGGYTTSTGGVYGSIYVPASMLASYKTRTNWSFFSSRFVGI